MNYVLVDDEERALNLLRIMLTRFDGFSKENDHIYTFTQPVEALDFIRRTLVDVVFLDIEMPMLNGITLGKQISSKSGKQRICGRLLECICVFLFSAVASGGVWP